MIKKITDACAEMIASGDGDLQKLALQILTLVQRADKGRRIMASKAAKAAKAAKPVRAA